MKNDAAGVVLQGRCAGPAPTVVMFDGLDNAKELSVLFGGVEIGRRGIHTLAIDGPGQGEALRLRAFPAVSITRCRRAPPTNISHSVPKSTRNAWP